MEGLTLDERALRLLRRCHPGHGLLITIVCHYGLTGATLTVEPCSTTQAEHDPDLVRLDNTHPVPIYAHRRVATYTLWYPLRVTARGFGPWQRFALEHEGTLWRDLVRWEQTHPGLCRALPASA